MEIAADATKRAAAAANDRNCGFMILEGYWYRKRIALSRVLRHRDAGDAPAGRRMKPIVPVADVASKLGGSEENRWLEAGFGTQHRKRFRVHYGAKRLSGSSREVAQRWNRRIGRPLASSNRHDAFAGWRERTQKAKVSSPAPSKRTTTVSSRILGG